MCSVTNYKYLMRLFLIPFFAFLASGELLAEPNTNPSLQFHQTLQAGDAVRIFVWQVGQQNAKKDLSDLLSDDYVIDGKGYVIFPIIGRIKVKGMTVAHLEEKLVEQYKPYMKDPIIVITPLIRVVMIGAFNKPGSYRIDPKSSLWELVELAGGPNEGCDLRKMKVERGGEVVVDNLLKSFEQGYSLDDVNIRSGDQIIAPYRRRIGFDYIRRYLSFIMTAALFYVRVKEGF